jgi:hypothetical protein
MRRDAGVLTKASVSVGACEGSVLTAFGNRRRQQKARRRVRRGPGALSGSKSVRGVSRGRQNIGPDLCSLALIIASYIAEGAPSSNTICAWCPYGPNIWR